MNRILRRRHRLLVAVLAILLPVLLAAAILTREEMPRQELVPAAPRANHGAPIFDGTLTDGDLQFHTHLFHSDAGDLLELQSLRPLVAPDVLVYWIGEGKSREEGRLLGALKSAPALFELPVEARGGGSLDLYSLGWQRSAANLKLPATGEARP